MDNPPGTCQILIMTNASQLTDLRNDIDAVDRALVELLAKREKLVERVLTIKKAENLPARIQTRVNEVVDNACARAAEIGMNPDLARTVWSAMVEWFVAHEEKQLSSKF
jgi:isochorismate pyruvate lyase